MKQFIYLDYDIVNSIIAQSEKGIISQQTNEKEATDSLTNSRSGETTISGTAGGAILKLAKAEGSLTLNGSIGKETNSFMSSKEVIEKTLHDAAYDIAYEYMNPKRAENSEFNYGEYIDLRRVFNIVDLEYLERISSKGSLIDYIKKTETANIEAQLGQVETNLNREQIRANVNKLKNEVEKQIEQNNKKYDDFKSTIEAFRQLIPYNRMAISQDGYLIPMDEKYFRVDPKNLGFKYGGDITCVGVVTNIIGEAANPNDSTNIFATLQFTVNEVLRSILPTKENNIYVIHPIAIYYNRIEDSN